MRKSVLVGASAAIVFGAQAFVANAEEADDMLKEDTVVCINNQIEGEDAFAVLAEYFYDKFPYARQVDIKENKTVCVRYRRAREIKPIIVNADDMENGRLKRGADRIECNRAKGGFAKFYVLSKDENGRKQCLADPEKAGDPTRALVKGRKAINS